MAAKTYYLLGTATDTNYPVTGANSWWGKLQEGGTAPTAANSAYGYAPGKLAVSNFARSRLGATGTSATTSASSFIDSTSGPTAGTGSAGTTSGDSFCTPTALTGTFANTAWTFALNMRAGVSGLNGIMRCRVWKSANANGSSATALTTSTLVTSAAAALSTSVDTNLGFTWSPGAITLSNEYLFFQLEWKESATTAGGSNTDTALFRINTALITTPSWANAYALAANSGTFALTGNAATLTKLIAYPTRILNALTGVLPTAFADARTTSATYTNSSGVVSTASSNVLRTDYSSTGTLLGYSIEPAATNIALQSSTISVSPWKVDTGASLISTTAADPAGGTSATIVNYTTTGASTFLQSVSITVGAIYTISVWVRKSTTSGSNWIRLTTNDTAAWNTGIGGKYALTSAWTRISLTGVILAAAGANGAIANIGLDSREPTAGAYDTDIVGSVDMYGMQIELGSVATSYVQTVAATVTRGADVASFTLNSAATDLLFTFDDGSIQTFSSLTGGSTYTISTPLNRQWVMYIDDNTIPKFIPTRFARVYLRR